MKTLVLSVLGCVLGFLSVSGANGEKVYVAKYKGNKVCAITYTFDDGLVEQYTLAAPQLEKRGFRGTFGINGSRINQDNEHITDTTRMTWVQVKDLSERGHEITNHGWKHKNFSRFPLEEIKEDVRKNDSAIHAVTGIWPRTFLYPNNNKKMEGRRFVEQQRVGTRLFQRSLGGKSTPENLESWVDGLLEKGEWGVAMTHGLTYGYDAFPNPQRFWEHLDKVKAREEQIWVGTLREVLAYTTEQKEIELKIDKRKKSLWITPRLSLNPEVFTEPLTMVIEKEGIKKISVQQGKTDLPVHIVGDSFLFDFNPFGGTIIVKEK